MRSWKGGGTTLGGEHRGARKFKVVITDNRCTCGVPQRKHIPCSHMVTACRHRCVDHLDASRMPAYFTMDAMVKTWSPRFEPFLDEDHWAPYNGPRYVADVAMLWKKRGPRRRVRYTMDMDRLQAGGSKRRKSGTPFLEDPQAISCSSCHNTGHNRLSCPKNKVRQY